MSFDVKDQYTVLYGGSGCTTAPSDYCTDTWTFSDSAGWRDLGPDGGPSPRQGAAMTYDASDNVILLFGGAGSSGVLSDTWEFSGGAWTLVHPSISPPARARAAMTYDPADGNVLLFGGVNFTSGVYYSDTWTFHAGAWAEVTTASSPMARAGGGLAYDSVDGYALLFGGTTNYCCSGAGLGDTWEFRSGSWTELAPSSAPVERDAEIQLSMVEDGSQGVVLFGGWSPSGGCGSPVGDTWSFSNGQWNQLSYSVAPSARQGAAMDYDPIRGQVLLFGGEQVIPGTGGFGCPSWFMLADTWSFGGSAEAGGWLQNPAFAVTQWQVPSTIDIGPLDVQLSVTAVLTLIGPASGVSQTTYQSAVSQELGISFRPSDVYDPVLIAQIGGLPQFIQQLNAELNTTLPWLNLDLWPLLGSWFDDQGLLDMFTYLEITTPDWEQVLSQYLMGQLAQVVGDLKSSPSSICDTILTDLNYAEDVANIGGGVYGQSGVGPTPAFQYNLTQAGDALTAGCAFLTAYQREVDLLDFTGQAFLGEVWDGVRAAITAFDLLFDLTIPSSSVTTILDDFTTFVDPPGAQIEPSLTLANAPAPVLGWTGFASGFVYDTPNVGVAFGNGTSWEMLVARDLPGAQFGVQFVGSAPIPVPYYDAVGGGPGSSPAVAAGVLTVGQSAASAVHSVTNSSGISTWTFTDQIALPGFTSVSLANGSTEVETTVDVEGAPASGVVYSIVNGSYAGETAFFGGHARVFIPPGPAPVSLYFSSDKGLGTGRTVSLVPPASGVTPAGLPLTLVLAVGALAVVIAVAAVLVVRRSSKGKRG